MTLVLTGVTALFLGFTGAYLYSRMTKGLEPIDVPVLFFSNALLLVAASYTLVQTKKAYEVDHTSRYKTLLNITMLLTLVFLGLQIYAWKQMYDLNIGIASSTLTSYLYVISIVHFAHVIAGIPFLAFFIKDARKRLVEPASVLLYLSDEDKKRKLVVLTIYWHFLDALWIFLVLFFLVNRLI